MSRLGKLPIILPANTHARLEDGFIVIKGIKGEIKEKLHNAVNVEVGEKEIKISVDSQKSKKEKAIWGTYSSVIKNMVKGVTDGFEKKLEINGVGYRASVSGSKIILNVGFSHPVEYVLPAGISAKTEANTITISGIDKQLVGEISAQIRKIRPPEPYKGKGIKYAGEVIRRKAGKTAAKGK